MVHKGIVSWNNREKHSWVGEKIVDREKQAHRLLDNKYSVVFYISSLAFFYHKEIKEKMNIF